MDNLKKTFQNAIYIFDNEGKKIEGVYDLLIRGGASKEEHLFVPDFSDLDTSIIVKEINHKILNQIRDLYNSIKQVFPYKLSITVVTKHDFLSKHHHHGIKPVYYRYMLNNSLSLKHRIEPFSLTKIDREALRLDCLANLSYLIHDIRNRYIQLDIGNRSEQINFLLHLIKRTKHFIRNTLFILTGEINEEINVELYKRHFVSLDPEFPIFLKKCKINFEKICIEQNIEQYIKTIINTLELMHQELLFQFKTKQQSKNLYSPIQQDSSNE